MGPKLHIEKNAPGNFPDNLRISLSLAQPSSRNKKYLTNITQLLVPEISFWKFIFLGIALFLIVFIFIARGFAVIKLKYLNLIQLKELKALKWNSDDQTDRHALQVVIEHCQTLNSKWLLEKSDLNILENSNQLIKQIACSYYPNSKYPLEEARIRLILKAFSKLKNHLLALTNWTGANSLTQFRIRHVITLSNAWEAKQKWKQWKVLFFLKKYRLHLLFKWFFFLIRCLDIIFWAIKMISFIIQDIVFKIFLVRWYLVIGKLAIQVYSDQTKDPDIRYESILNDLDLIPESKNQKQSDLPEKIKKISDFSRNQILYSTWSVEWIKVKKIYIDLIKNIACEHHPKSPQPVYEVKLSQLLASGVYFSGQIADIQNHHFLNKILDFRVRHIMKTKDTADYLKNNQVISWVNQHKLTYIFKYSLLLFKVIQKKHPALLFKDFAFTLAGEGCKRWLYLYLHDKIAIEINALYNEPTNHRSK